MAAQKRLSQKATTNHRCKIHPVVMFPFRFRRANAPHIKRLIGFLDDLHKNHEYFRTIFVVNGQTPPPENGRRHNRQLRVVFNDVLKRMKQISTEESIVYVRSVDTCQMWLAGLGYAFEHSESETDVYWLIPGDFLYAAKGADEGLKDMKNLPTRVIQGKCTLAVGEIQIDRDNAKQLIDTHGTYGLLYNWFPDEALKIGKLTKKPRTEFFAIAHSRLKYLLSQRWFPYEQTIFVLLNAVRQKWRVHKVELRGLIDDPNRRETLHGAMEQIERCERALKMQWREWLARPNVEWEVKYRALDSRSREIRRAALTVLGQYLK